MTQYSGGARCYYERTFLPIASDVIIYLLGTCCGRYSLAQREISLEMVRYDGESGQRIDFPMRKHVFSSVAQFAAELTRKRMDAHVASVGFGPIFPALHLEEPLIRDKPREFERSTAMKAGVACGLGEMVLDVDLDHVSYDRTGICGCGNERKVCDACWECFMIPAQSVLQWIITQFMGFKRVFCVFSGRRGFHMWICDPRVICMSAPERRSLVQLLRVPSPGMGACESDEYRDHVYRMLAPIFDNSPVLRSRYTPPTDPHAQADAHRDAVFQALWPRIDEPVASDARHLHKIPLVLHPVTGAICVVMGDPDCPKLRFRPSVDRIYPDITPDEIVTEVLGQGVDVIREALEE